MAIQFGDFESTLTMFDELRQRMGRLWDDFDSSGADPRWSAAPLASRSWPFVNVYDAGSNLVVKADVPGISEKDLAVNISNGTLAISGERKVDAPEGYWVHRRERGAVSFARSLSLPCKVEAERATASVRDGVLTITLPKAAEAQPRQIAVRSQ